MPTYPRAVAEEAARTLLLALADLPGPTPLRVADAEGKLACLILVWDSRRAMPTAAGERRRRRGGERAECKRDVVDVVRSAGQPLTRKEVVRALKAAGKNHGPGTAAKALADLTAAGELINYKDKQGYRLPDWRKRRAETPSLF